MIIYILYHKNSKNKQSLFRFSFVQGTQCLLSMISGLCLSRLQGVDPEFPPPFAYLT